MAVSAYEQVAAKTQAMESAIYAALDAIDAYSDTIGQLRAELESAAEPNAKLIKRLGQFLDRAQSMTRTVEDEVVTDLLFCVDRLFSVDLAERGEFI